MLITFFYSNSIIYKVYLTLSVTSLNKPILKIQFPYDTFHILLAEDDSDDQHFFAKALQSLPFKTWLTTKEDGAELMAYIKSFPAIMPDVIFLDYNMPRKNGADCLIEIKADPLLKDIPVILYSTSFSDYVTEVLFKNGAHYFFRKETYLELRTAINNILQLLEAGELGRPTRDHFMLSLLDDKIGQL